MKRTLADGKHRGCTVTLNHGCLTPQPSGVEHFDLSGAGDPGPGEARPTKFLIETISSDPFLGHMLLLSFVGLCSDRYAAFSIPYAVLLSHLLDATCPRRPHAEVAADRTLQKRIK